MATFETGIKGYVKAATTVEVYFPIDDRGSVEIACKHCPFFVNATRRCGLNQTLVNYPERHVGVGCPLEEVESEEVKDGI